MLKVVHCPAEIKLCNPKYHFGTEKSLRYNFFFLLLVMRKKNCTFAA